MGVVYFFVYLFSYGVPLLITAGVAFGLRMTLLRAAPFGWGIAIVVAVGLSCVPALWMRYQLRQDEAKFAPDEVRPDRLDLPKGALLVLQPFNHAGLSCDAGCRDFMQSGFVTHVRYGEPEAAFNWTGSEQLGEQDLWQAIADENPDRTQPFPYRYLFISTETWRWSGAGEDGSYRKAHWPTNGKGAHALLSIPPSGLLDFQTAKVHFRRFNIQEDVPALPFWGFVTQTQVIPEAQDIFAEVIALQRP